ncbi:hypothetical protein DRN73_07400, partial [Candidatus Pacearchaeota archaeon]
MLEWINQQIQEENKRLILISGDKAMWEAAYSYQFNEKNFAELFIRKPKIYLGVPKFLRFEKNTQTKYERGLVDWIDVILAKYGLKAENYPYNLKILIKQEKINKKIFSNISSELLNIKKEWEEFIRLVGVNYIIPEIKKAAQELKEINWEELQDKIKDKQQKVLKTFWSTITIVGYSSLGTKKQLPKYLPIRGVPGLRFTLQPVKTYVEELCKSLNVENLLKQLGENPKDSFKKFIEVDKSGYTAFLLFALAFAALGRWRAAIALAEYALYIADFEAYKFKLPNGHEPITGNEAAYLLAWSIRHNITSPKELEKCKELLEEAKERKKKATGKGDDVRFEAERVIIDIIDLFFQIFGEEKQFEEEKKFEELLSKLCKCYNEILNLLKRIENESEEYIKILLKKQLLAYLFYLFFIRKVIFKEKIFSEEQKLKSLV